MSAYVRHNDTNRYFKDIYEGIPVDGYTVLFKRMLDHPNITLQLDTDYFDIREKIGNVPTLYTGPIDRFFNYKYGYLDWRTIDFEQEIHEVEDFQGCSVMNYADIEIPFTRIHEFKHYHPERPPTNTTITFKEFPRVAPEDAPYYPVKTLRNRTMLKQYQNESIALKNIWFGGRLGSYQYLDMDSTIAYALDFVRTYLNS